MNSASIQNPDGLIFMDEVYKIISAAMEVSNQLGNGFLEAVYQEALAIEFSERDIPFDEQKRITIKYKNKVLSKEYVADFICFDCIILEVKAIKTLSVVEEAQMLNYLKATHFPLGLLINFGSSRLQWKRLAKTR